MNMNIALRIRFIKVLMLLALITSLFAGCAKIPQFTDKPFKIDQDVFHRTVKVIALEPLGLPEMKRAEQVRAEFEPLLIEKLKEAGFTVLPSDKYDALWKSMSKQDGGLYDPMTGKKNEAKVKEIEKKIYDELRAQHQIDAIARVLLIQTTAYFAGCKARWHGVAQDMESCSVLGSGGNYNGRISAISLLVAIRDSEGKTLFMNAGGLQQTSILKTGFFKAAQFENIATDDLFSDKLKNQASVDVALYPLIRKQK